jgi:hypothetical protein
MNIEFKEKNVTTTKSFEGTLQNHHKCYNSPANLCNLNQNVCPDLMRNYHLLSLRQCEGLEHPIESEIEMYHPVLLASCSVTQVTNEYKNNIHNSYNVS